MTPEARQTASDKITALCCESKAIDGVTVYRLRGANDIWDATPPDWFGDLNAMASAEKMLPYERLGDYLNRLVELTGYCDTKTFTQANFDLATATASQRAEAFLRALNLWVEPTTATKP